MSQSTSQQEDPQLSSKTQDERTQETTPKSPGRIFLVPYPKFIFLYPTFIASLLAAVWMLLTERHVANPEDSVAVAVTWMFLGVLAVNAVVIAFDFPRATSLTMFFLLAAVVLGAVLAFTLRPEWFPAVTSWLETVRPVANATFFCVVVLMMSLIFAAVFISVRFDYWEVRPNELLHHHGILSDLKRFSAPNLRIDKEVNDVFEYLLLGSGRLILQPSGERRAIILDNVLFISNKEVAITKMLGALQVQVREESR